MSTSFQVVVDPSTNATTQRLILRNEAGERIDPDDLRVLIDAGDRRIEDPPRTDGDSLSAGTSVTYNLTTADLCSGDADSATVRYVHEPSDSPLAETTVHIDRSASFTVGNNSVGSDAPYRAEVTIPGSGYATIESHGGTDYYLYWPFESWIVISGNGSKTTLTPFPDGDPHDALTGTPATTSTIRSTSSR